MRPPYTIDDTQWEQLVAQVGELFDDLTIKRGFQFYKQERVQQLALPGEREVEATIEGSEHERYEVTINLDELSESRCECPAGGRCKHVIAALLQYANLQGRMVNAIVNAKSNAGFAAARGAAEAKAKQKVEAASKFSDQASSLAELPIAQWHELMASVIAPLDSQTRNSQYAQEALTALIAVKPDLPPVLTPLFDLHIRLHVLVQLTRPSQNQSQTQWHTTGFYMGFHTHVAAAEVQEGIVACFGQPLPLAEHPAYWQQAMDTAVYMRRLMLTDTPSHPYFSDLYIELWRRWIEPQLSDTQVVAEELRQLEAAEDELGQTLSRASWVMARSWMHFYLLQDESAWALMRGTKARLSVESLLRFPYELVAREQWTRLTSWLAQLGPLLNIHRIESLSVYSQFWDQATEHDPEAEERMWEALTGMLPLARKLYEDKLIEFERWKPWIDLQLSSGREPLSFKVSELAPIEKNAPELLLPFYHQAVERYVAQKNRDGYKAAVKLLKRLAKLYKKLKQDDRFEHYISSFADRNSRLRALQEELRKGKLIP
ncbi:putative Zn finger protein [Paenibacillus phyllosphaerae]|uniref:Putative Zn finger protein n=1 Tax=Paenibacillus phyllosphaerae TaxID=274593 RepID=A0A7W5FQG7_9BACL|nr:SWIM zinc finger family protein [Paenibacillus phyllosphaerae]MBB3113232.1 putative Zn finger protein [Paenibacillus phyllosphaerae]